MRLSKKHILIIILAIPILFGIKEYWRMNIGGFAGSYPFVETYEFEVTEQELLKAIENLKLDKPQLRPNNDNVNKHSFWTMVTFYYSDTYEYVNTWTRPSINKKFTTLAFVGLTPKSDIYAGKRINADYYYFENRNQIKKFESEIANPIKKFLKATK